MCVSRELLNLFLIPEGARPFGKGVTSATQPGVGEESIEGREGRKGHSLGLD